jgi:PiT family inorganic phosphate transporter
MLELALLGVMIAAAIGLGVVNGLNDAANAVAASIGSRAISPRNAVTLAAVLNFTGAATGTAVALTIAARILAPEAISYVTAISGLVAAIVWGAVATRLGLPVSITHGFVSGLAAAGVAVAGWHAVMWNIIEVIGSSVVIAPVLGFVGGIGLMVALFWIFRRSAPTRMRVVFSRLQWLTTGFLAYTHGLNDGQMPIGVIVMALAIHAGHVGQLATSAIPWWARIVSGLAISLGTAVGGWRVIRTVGLRITDLEPIHGFASQASAASVIEIASLLGIPVSTTHCVAGATMGVGATRRLSAVRWGVSRNIVLAWVLTFPICGVLGWLIATALSTVL